MDRQLVLQRRSERDDPGHQMGTADGEDAREAAGAALTDDGDLLAAVLGQAFHAPLEALARALGAVDVHGDPGTTGAMPRVLQPVAHAPQRVIAGEQPRDQHDRLALAVADAFAAPDG